MEIAFVHSVGEATRPAPRAQVEIVPLHTGGEAIRAAPKAHVEIVRSLSDRAATRAATKAVTIRGASLQVPIFQVRVFALSASLAVSAVRHQIKVAVCAG